MRLPLHTVEHIGPDGVQMVISLKKRLSLAGTAAFQTSYQAVATTNNGVVSTLERRVLLLAAYLHSWRGGVLDTVPCDVAALGVLPVLPVLTLAMDAADALYFAEPPLPTEERGEPITDERHAALVKRWDKKLGMKGSNTYRAGLHDGVVSLMVRFNWTEQQALTENSPEVLAELYARLDAETVRQKRDDARAGRSGGSKGRPGSFPTKPSEG